jgi:Mn2+/Fe2+ NRAMP family transporter
MGNLVNKRLTTVVATIVTAVIVGLNLFLLEQTFLG